MATVLKTLFARSHVGTPLPTVAARAMACGRPCINVQSMGIKTKSSAKKRFLRRADGTVKRWKAGRRHLNYNQSRQKLNKSMGSQEWKLLGGKK